MKVFDFMIIVILGIAAINWGFIGIANVDLIREVFGHGWLTRSFYILFGASGLYHIFFWSQIAARLADHKATQK